MWVRLEKQIEVQRAELAQNLSFHGELLETGRERPLAGIELSAAAAFLHSLYSGIENLFRRIVVELDGGMPSVGDRHQRLLDEMTRATSERPRVISDELQGRLKEYLQFRHLFRHIYAFRLEWERMGGLLLGAEQLVEDLEKELTVFTRTMNDNRLGMERRR